MTTKRVTGPGFNSRVYAVVRQVPRGCVSTYGDVAAMLGSSRVARHVGFALAALQDPEVPWHRVVNGRARISFPSGSTREAEQRRRLIEEGVVFEPSGRIRSFMELRYDWPEVSENPQPEDSG